MPTIPARLHCPRCRYELTDLPAASDPQAGPDTGLVCPECGLGTTLYAAADTLIPHRGWDYTLMWLFTMGMLLLLGGCGLSVVIYAVWMSAGGGR